MRIAVLLAFNAPLHARRWNRPHGRVQIKFSPCRRAQFARTLKQQGGQLQRRPHDRPALITTNHADQFAQLHGVGNGREVFAVPGSPLDPRSEGTNRLIRDGATLVTRASDILVALGSQQMVKRGVFLEPEMLFQPPSDPSPTDSEHLLALLSPSPVEIDDLIRESGLSAATVTGLLLELELAGIVSRQTQAMVALA